MKDLASCSFSVRVRVCVCARAVSVLQHTTICGSIYARDLCYTIYEIHTAWNVWIYKTIKKQNLYKKAAVWMLNGLETNEVFLDKRMDPSLQMVSILCPSFVFLILKENSTH